MSNIEILGNSGYLAGVILLLIVGGGGEAPRWVANFFSGMDVYMLRIRTRSG